MRLIKNSLIILYDDANAEQSSVTVPNLKGMTSSQAINSLRSRNLNINIEGSGKVISQSPSYSTSVSEGSIVTVTLKEEIKDTY